MKSSFATKVKKDSPLGNEPKVIKGGNKVSTNRIIFHHSSISKSGCMCCRKRKKKCDENYPTCNACKRRSVECKWDSEKNPLTKEKSYMEKLKLHHIESLTEERKGGLKLKPYQINGGKKVDFGISGQEISSSKNKELVLDDQKHSSQLLFLSSSHKDDELSIGNTKFEAYNVTSPGSVSLMNDLSNYIEKNDDPILDEAIMNILNGNDGYLAVQDSTLAENEKARVQRLIDIAHKIISEQRLLPLNRNILYQIQLHLDDLGVIFLENYVFNVTKILGLASEEFNSNYFLKTFFSVATNNEAILLALASWGGSFLHDSDGAYKIKSAQYMKRACELMEHSQSKAHLDKFECYNVLCFFLIYIGNLICGGDVKDWYVLVKKCFRLLNQFGGIQKFLASFNFSNDAKWIISDLQSHDIMSSVSFNQGTYHSHSDYVKIFSDEFYLSYGIDPLQGCSQPLFLLLTEIINIAKDVKDNLRTIESLSSCETGNTRSRRDNRNERLAILEKNYTTYKDLTEKVKACTPNESQLSMLIHSKRNFEIQMSLFELFSFVCQIVLEMEIKGQNPLSADIQLLLLKALNTLDVIVDTGTIGVVSLPMLICGICCCSKQDRIDMKKRFDRALSVYNVGNLHRIWEIVQMIWKRNDGGKKSLNWAEVAKEQGWEIYVG